MTRRVSNRSAEWLDNPGDGYLFFLYTIFVLAALETADLNVVNNLQCRLQGLAAIV